MADVSKRASKVSMVGETSMSAQNLNWASFHWGEIRMASNRRLSQSKCS